MKKSHLLIGAVALFAVVAQNAFAQAPSTNPNIVVMLMDNLGYGEVGVYGGGILRGAETPNIDQLASHGMRLLGTPDPYTPPQ